MPRPIMQPTWESVKVPGSTPQHPIVDYSMNYHRAFYDVGYDNYEDIYTQRWRMEDVEWRVVSGDFVETLNLVDNLFELTNSVTGSMVARYNPADRESVLLNLLGPDNQRVIMGQVRCLWRDALGQGRGRSAVGGW